MGSRAKIDSIKNLQFLFYFFLIDLRTSFRLSSTACWGTQASLLRVHDVPNQPMHRAKIRSHKKVTHLQPAKP